MDKKGNIRVSMNVIGTGISAQVYINLPNGGNQASVDISPNFNSRRITLRGELLKPFRRVIFSRLHFLTGRHCLAIEIDRVTSPRFHPQLNMLRTGVIFVLGYSQDSLMLCRGAVHKKRDPLRPLLSGKRGRTHDPQLGKLMLYH